MTSEKTVLLDVPLTSLFDVSYSFQMPSHTLGRLPTNPITVPNATMAEALRVR